MTLVNPETGEVVSPLPSPTKGGRIAESDAPALVTPDGQEAVPITDWLDEFRRGSFVREASIEFHQLVGEVLTLDKVGTLTLTLKVKPLNSSQVEITCDAKAKRPEAPAPAAAYYVDQMGRPTRHDPYQGSMFQENEES